MNKKFYSQDEINKLKDNFNLKDYFKHLENRGEVIYLFKSGKDEYYTDTSRQHKYSVGEKSYYDFKTGEGKGSIKAVEEFEKKDFKEALDFISDFSNTFIINPQQAERKRTEFSSENKPQITDVVKPNNSSLLGYFTKRGISEEILSNYTQQVHYKQNVNNVEKNYFGIAIKNESEGYDIRNPYAKIKIGKSDISVVHPENASNGIVVFEGMTDLLSFLELQKQNNIANNKTLISLNSVVNADLFIDKYSDYDKKILLCLDGDADGTKATNKILSNFDKAKDVRALYSISAQGNNDLNNYLQNKILINNDVKQFITTTNSVGSESNGISNIEQNESRAIADKIGKPNETMQSLFEFNYNGGLNVDSKNAGDGFEVGVGAEKGRNEKSTPSEQLHSFEKIENKTDYLGGGESTNIPELDILLSHFKPEKNNNESIAQIVNLATYIDDDSKVQLTDNINITEELLDAISGFKSGGVEKKGRGVLDEYYTEDNIVGSIYNLVHNLLPKNQNIKALEPSSGTGNFIKEFSSKNNLISFTGFEINEHTARISKLRNPTADINLKSYEENFISPSGEKKEVKQKYDLIVGNPPYGAHRGFYKGLGEEKSISRYEDYFVKRCLDEAKENAIVAMVLPSTYLNRVKEINDSKLLSAFRLPTGAFKGTQVGTDIVILKKAENNVERNTQTYFEENPTHILGDLAEKTNRFGKSELYVKGSLEDALLTLQEISSENSIDIADELQTLDSEISEKFKSGNVLVAKEGGYEFTLIDRFADESWTARTNSGQKIIFEFDSEHYDLKDEIKQEKTENKEILSNIDTLISTLDNTTFKSPLLLKTIDSLKNNKIQISENSLSDDDLKKLNKDVLSLTERYSHDSSITYKQVTSVEISKKHLKYHFQKEDSIVPASIHNDVKVSEAELSAFKDADYNGVLANPDKHFEFANYYLGKYVHDFYYIEGNIYQKLEQLEYDFSDKLDDEKFKALYEKQKEALTAVLPAEKSLDNIILSPNHEFVHNFILGRKDKDVWNPDKRGYDVHHNMPFSLAEDFKSFISTLPNAAFEGSSSWEVRSYVDNEQVTGSDKERNALVRERRKESANTLFRKYLQEELTPDQQKAVAREFNRKYNNLYVPNYSHFPLFSKIHQNFKGSPLKLTEVQKSGIGRNTTKGVGLLAHEVGFGKTLSGVLSMHEAMARGNATRPLIVVPNSNILKQWAETIFEIIPDAKVNVLGNLGKDYDLSKFKMNDNEITLVTYEGFNNIGFDERLTKEMASKFSYISDSELGSLKSISERDMQLALAKTDEIEGQMKKGKLYDWEDFGFDHLTFDEVHNANHIVGKVKIEDRRFASDFRGQNQRTSALGINTWMASQYIQEKNDGRNVSLLSATPFTNKPLEYYSILSLIANKKLEEMGYFNVNNFFETFMEADNDMEINAKGDVNFKMSIRRFKNNDVFQKLLSEFIDIKGEADNPELVRPERHNKEYKIEQNDLTKEQYELLNENYNEGEPGAILTHILNGRLTAISPYLSPYNEDVPTVKEFVENSPKLDLTMKLIAQNKKDIDSGQIIYSELAVSEFPKLKEYLVNEVGYAEGEVALITGQVSKPQKEKIQEDFNEGKVKVIIGSEAIQEGMNLQKNTSDIYLLSLPYNFTSLRQVEGRAWRQGNINSNVRINYMLTNDSIDVFMLQKLQDKQNRYLESIQGGKDVLDVSDINTLELKTALITKPETRAQIEIKLKAKEIDVAKSKLEADSAFFLRKFDTFNKEQEFLTKLYSEKEKYVNYAKDGNDFWQTYIDRQQDLIDKQILKIEEHKNDLKNKGVDVTLIDEKISDTQLKLEALEAQKEKLPELELDLIDKYTKEKEASFIDFDVDKLVNERAEETKLLFANTLITQSEEKDTSEDYYLDSFSR